MWQAFQTIPGGRKTVFSLLISAMLLGCGGGGGGGGGGVSPPPPPPPPPPVRTPQPVFFIAEDPTLMQRHLFRAGDEGGAQLQLSPTFANPDADVFSFAVSPDRQTIAFAADGDVDSVPELYIVPAAGGTASPVGVGLPSGTGLSSITWSPDGSQIAYIANPLGRAPRGFQINEVFAVNRDGSNNRKINGTVGSPPVVALNGIRWSPDSRYLAQGVYSLDPFFTLIGINTYDSDVGTQNSTRATPALDWQNSERMQNDYRWTADSSRLLFRSSHEGVGSTQLYSVLADGSGVTRINPNLVSDGDVAWYSESPDGGTLVYAAQQLSTTYDLFASDVSGAGNRRLNTGGDFNSFGVPMQWSPNGSQIAYSTDQDTQNVTESYVTNVDGSGTTKLHADLMAGQFANGVKWSPDGTRLAYISNLDDPNLNQTYSVDADGSNLTNISAIVLSTNSTFLPVVWSPDGQHVAYLSRSGANNQIELYRSAADGSAGNRLNADLANDADIDFRFTWSNDSSRIVFIDEIFDPIMIFDEPQNIWAGTLDGAAPITLNGTTEILGSFVY